MPSSAIFLTVVISAIIANTVAFKIENPQAAEGFRYQQAPVFSTLSPFQNAKIGVPSSRSFLNQPIAGYPKVPPPNAYESGGSEDDLLPPFEEQTSGFGNLRSHSFRRSIEDVKVDPKTGYPLVAQPGWKDAGGNEDSLELPVADDKKTSDQGAVDPKTGYPLVAQDSWKYSGGDEGILELPLEETKVTVNDNKEEVDPKTGYPLVAQESWKYSGGDEGILELPLEDTAVIAGKKTEAVDPKTGYPLVAQEGWKYAGGDGEILQLPLEETETQGKEEKEAVDPKTGYPLVAKPTWKFAGGDGEIIQLPLEDSEEEKVDPKTGYPLIAKPSWKDAGGNEEILDLPLEQPADQNQAAVDPKTGYPLIAQPAWQDAGGNGDFLELPLEQSNEELSQEKVDPKTGYPLVAQPGWKHAGGNEDILQLPLEESFENIDNKLQERVGVALDEIQLTELRPPPFVQTNFPIFPSDSLATTGIFSRRSFQQPANVVPQNQIPNTFVNRQPFGFVERQNKPVESSYSYTGPQNLLVMVTRFLNTDRLERRTFQDNESTAKRNFGQNGSIRQLQNNGQPFTSSTVNRNVQNPLFQNSNIFLSNGNQH